MSQAQLNRYAQVLTHVLRHCGWVTRDRQAAREVLGTVDLTPEQADEVIAHGLARGLFAEWEGGLRPAS